MRPYRGSALLAALVIIAVLAAITVATLELADSSKRQSAKDARQLSQVACVEAARQYLMSRLRVFGIEPTALTLDQNVSVDSGTRNLRTGHIDGPAVTAVRAVPGGLVGNNGRRTNADMTNVIGGRAGGRSSLGSAAYRVVVACTDPLAGDMELEFTIQYGL